MQQPEQLVTGGNINLARLNPSFFFYMLVIIAGLLTAVLVSIAVQHSITFTTTHTTYTPPTHARLASHP